MKEKRIYFASSNQLHNAQYPLTAVFPLMIVFILFSISAPAQPDYQWTFNNNGSIDYTLTSVSSTQVYEGSLPANDPNINLIVDKRYAVDVVNFGAHPFQVLAQGADSSSDVVLLSQGAATGSFEADTGVDWVDNGTSTVQFTFTADLANAMFGTGLSPGYRCGIHVSSMRGSFTIFGNGQEILDPIPAAIPKGSIAIQLETIATGLTAPIGIAAPDDGTNRLFIYDQAGFAHIIENGSLLSQPFLDVSGRLVSLGVSGPGSFDERGFLGMALHPDFSTNGKVYTYTSEPVSATADFVVTMTGTPNHQSVIAEWVVSSTDANQVDTSTRRELLRVDQPQFNHDGGTLRFSPVDGYLYIALGDGGNANDEGDGHSPGGNAQNNENIWGSLLRIDVDGNDSANGQYGIPADNPFVGSAGVDEIYAYGLRNPFLFSFDSTTGDLYAADVGQNDIEEIDIITSGGNYGWRLKEGTFFFDPAGFVTTEPVEPLPSGLSDPIAEYDHDEGLSIIGGFVYRGTEIPSLEGLYVFGDFGSSFSTPNGRLFYLDSSDEIMEFQYGSDDTQTPDIWIKGFGEDLDGNIYVCGSTEIGPFGSTGVVYKINPVTSSVINWILYQ